ncbi:MULTISPECIES: tetratricopeptide repeat protein [unclassified Sphingobium]|uniref:tetratricopeptide repeat protein n=1 Tax=unclassified Sphingobium TaxID=2611147 RepID=UPI0035A6BDBC
MKSRISALLLAGCLLALTPPAAAEVDDVVKQALALHGQGKPDQAYALLAPMESTRAGDPDYDYALGLAAADSGRHGAAIIALQRVIAQQPGNAPARAEIARVYAMAGDIDTARATFDTVVNDPTVPDPVRQRVGRLVRNYDREIAGGGQSLTGFVDVEGGIDSNINSATGLTSITLPVFSFLGPAALGGAATRMDEPYYQAQGGLSVSAGLSRQTAVFASVLGSWRDNLESRLFDQAAVTGTAGIRHSFANRDAISLSGQAQRFWLGRDGYRTSYGAIGQYTHLVGSGSAVALGAQYYRLDYDNDPLRDADRFVGSLTYTTRILFAGVAGGKENTVRTGADHLGYAFASAQAGTEYPLSDRAALIAGISAEHRDYEKTDPLFLKGRKDTQVDASVGVRVIVAGGFSVRPRVTWTRSFSNIDLYDYSRVTAAIGLRAEF